MRSLKITYQITSKEITNLVRTEKDGRVRQRLRAMKFISQGQTIPQVAMHMILPNVHFVSGFITLISMGQVVYVMPQGLVSRQRLILTQISHLMGQIGVFDTGKAVRTSTKWCYFPTSLL